MHTCPISLCVHIHRPDWIPPPFPSACQASANFPEPTSHTYSTSTATTTTTVSCHKKRRETTWPRITSPTVDSPKSLVRKKQNAVLAQTKSRLTSLAVVLLLHVLVEDLELLARLVRHHIAVLGAGVVWDEQIAQARLQLDASVRHSRGQHDECQGRGQVDRDGDHVDEAPSVRGVACPDFRRAL